MRKNRNQINALEASISTLDDAALRVKSAEFRAQHQSASPWMLFCRRLCGVPWRNDKRIMGMRHLMSVDWGITLHEGRIAEMRTGEGKTLMATFSHLPQCGVRPWCACGYGERLFGPP